jgi:hypothetical protein
MSAPGGNMIMRHNKVRDLLCKHVHMANGVAFAEPRNLLPGSGLRPDILIYLGTTKYVVDVTIIHPLGYTCLHQEDDPMDVAEVRKTDKYRLLTEHVGGIFIPFVVESLGGLGRAARHFLRTLSVFCKDGVGFWSHHDIVHGLTNAIAVAVQHDTYSVIEGAWRSTAAVPNSRLGQ